MRLWWLGLVACGGCGVLSGLDGLKVTDGGSGADTSVDDAGSETSTTDASLDVGSSCDAGACGAPTGFEPVLFSTSGGQCPPNATSVDVVVDPMLTPNACSCTCNFQPACLPETLSYSVGTGCTQSTTTQIVLDGGCAQGPGGLPPGHMAIGPFPPANTCSNVLQTNGKPSTTKGRLCSVADCSACTATTGFQVCFAQSGDVPCPNGMTKHTAGGDAQTACSPCTACSSTAKCKGTMNIYDDGQCGFLAGPGVAVDGTCQIPNADTLGSYKYLPQVEQGTCTAGTSTASVVVSARTTICCP